MKTLWTFENQEKLDAFCSLLKEQEVNYEIGATTEMKIAKSKLTISLEEGDYEKAKKLLLKHRKRKSTS